MPDINIEITPHPVYNIELTGKGPTGPQGPQGPAGPAGEPGPQGPQGEPGPRGESALTFEVGTVTTLPAGSDATVENTGATEGDIVLSFGIPQGVQGQQGASGRGVDIGTVINSLSSKAPSGFEACQGLEITEEENPELYLAAAGDSENEPCLPTVTYEQYQTELTNNNGNCGFFGLDTDNKKVKLPTLQKIYIEGGIENIGSYIPAGLPSHTHNRGTQDITGSHRRLMHNDQGGENGAFFNTPNSSTGLTGTNVSNAGLTSFQASRSWTGTSSDPIYSEGVSIEATTTVQTEAVYMYFYVCVNKYTEMERGPVYIPSVDSDGNLTWTNNGGLINPEPINIKGPAGADGAQGIDGKEGPAGPANTLSIGTVVQGLQAQATITGESPNQILNLVLPQGEDGQAASITVGETTTLPSGQPASVVNAGTNTSAVLNFSIPRGDTGPQGTPGADGADGFSPNINVKTSTPDEYILTVTNSTGSYDTPNLKGPQGEQGPQGEAAFSLAIGSVITGEAGTPANVVNTGTQQDQIWNITIPKGDKGDTGSQGPQGLQGPQGPQGEQGSTGPRGLQGVQGEPGPANNLSIGSVTSGESPSVTISGTSPNQILNFVLQPGPKGDTGETGAPGKDGTDGTNGVDGFTPTISVASSTDTEYTLKITNKDGSTTTPNLIGPQGNTGATGPQGAPGARGDAITQNLVTVSPSGGTLTVNLQTDVPIYSFTPTASTPVTLAFNTSGVSGTVITFEMLIDCTLATPTITYPVLLTWLNGTQPNITGNKKYILCFRSYNSGSTWIGSVQGEF